MKKAIGIFAGIGIILTLLYGIGRDSLKPAVDVERVPELKTLEE